jgi:pyruvate formate lyase activating enzyme
VFLKGCPLRCAWCHNPEGISAESELLFIENRCLDCGECRRVCPQQRKSVDGSTHTGAVHCIRCGACAGICPAEARQLLGRRMSVEEVMTQVLADHDFYDESEGGATFSGGEPFMQPHFLRSLLTACRASGVHTVVDTSGYVAREELLAAAPLVDLFLYDLKVMDDARHRQWTGVSNAGILDNLLALGAAHANIWIRVPLVPGFNDDADQLSTAARFAASVPGVNQVHLLPYHATAAHKWQGLGTPVSADSGRKGTTPTQENDPVASPESAISGKILTGSGPDPFCPQSSASEAIDRAKRTFQSFGLNTIIGG